MTTRDRLFRAEELVECIQGIREGLPPGDRGRVRDLRRIDALTRRARKLLEGVQRSTRATDRDRAEAKQVLDMLKGWVENEEGLDIGEGVAGRRTIQRLEIQAFEMKVDGVQNQTPEMKRGSGGRVYDAPGGAEAAAVTGKGVQTGGGLRREDWEDLEFEAGLGE